MQDFLLFWSRNILKSWQIGYGAFAFVEVISVIGAAILRYWRRKHREKWEDRTMKAAIALFFVAFLISAVFWAPFQQYEGEVDKNRAMADLKANVVVYRYSQDTRELFTDIQFVNNGSRRRTVLAVIFSYKGPDNQTHDLVKSLDEIEGAGQTPVYVEPNQPIVVTYRHEVYDEKLLHTDGVVFGLEITTIKQDGSMNYTNIEMMSVIVGFGGLDKDGNPAVGWLTGSQRNLSLDVVGGNYPVASHVTRPSPTPDTAASLR